MIADTSKQETIAAIASAPGAAFRGIIRISGPAALNVATSLFIPNPRTPLCTRTARQYPGEIRLSTRDDLAVPAQLFLWPTSRSYTGEPVAELHLVSSPPLLQMVLTAAFRCGARPAQPGEFTQRAFLSGKIDLLQAEAVLAVIDAGSQVSLDRALSQLAGGISGNMSELREQLLLHLADLEAGLDFVEEDIDFVHRDELSRRLSAAGMVLHTLLEHSITRMSTSGRYRVILAGLPNAGKSTLFNLLTGQESAIVSELAGTTRDFVSATLTLEQIELELIDTAGWEHHQQGIMQAAQAHRQDQADMADLILWCRSSNLSPDEQSLDRQLYHQLASQGAPILCINTKSDLNPAGSNWVDDNDPDQIAFSGSQLPPALYPTESCGRVQSNTEDALNVSRDHPSQIDALRMHLVRQLTQLAEARGELIASTAARCQDSLRRAHHAIVQAAALLDQGAGDELIALELRSALDFLGQVVGAVYTDDILDRIFSRFCIGK